MREHFIRILVGLISVVCCSSLEAEIRIALVIGNSSYEHAGRLANPVNDAELLSRVLGQVGFTVTKQLDATRTQMQQSMLSFSRFLKQPDTVGLFFYAGHGLQVHGLNYLVPTDAEIADEGEVPSQAVGVAEFLATLDGLGRHPGHMNVLILDACRNNPFARGWRSATRGLAPMEAPSGTLIAFSTAPGQEAADGQDGNSPYAKALSQAIMTKGLPVEETFKRARAYVMQETAHNDKTQIPWEESSLTGQFYFVPDSNKIAIAAGGTIDDVDLAFWLSIRQSSLPAEYQAYLMSFPNGKFSELARSRLTQLSKSKMGVNGVRDLIDPAFLPSEPPDYTPPHGVLNDDTSIKPRPIIKP